MGLKGVTKGVLRPHEIPETSSKPKGSSTQIRSIYLPQRIISTPTPETLNSLNPKGSKYHYGTYIGPIKCKEHRGYFKAQVYSVQLHGRFGYLGTLALFRYCQRLAGAPGQEPPQDHGRHAVHLRSKTTSPKGPCTGIVNTWALTGFLYPYFGAYESTI